MNRNMEYEVVSQNTCDKLKTEVCLLMADGWDAQGGIMVDCTPTGETTYLQSMIREKDADLNFRIQWEATKQLFNISDEESPSTTPPVEWHSENTSTGKNALTGFAKLIGAFTKRENHE